MRELDKAREYFGQDQYSAQQTGIEILDAKNGYAKCSLRIEDKHKNAQGRVMGGVIFTMADYAFAIAANLGRSPTVTHTSQIVYLSFTSGNVLFAETEKIREGRKTCFYRIIVTDDKGESIAHVTTTGFILD